MSIPDHAPLVSIIVNNYNYGNYIEEAIISALQQDYIHKEIIIVDDGSTDNSAEVITSYKNDLKIIFKGNGGQASAFNQGFDISKGNIVIFLDADDKLLPNTVSRIVEEYGDGHFSKIHWQLLTIDTAGNSTGKILPVDTLAEGYLKKDVIANGPVACGGPPFSPPTSGNAWNKKFLEEIFPIPEKEFRQTADFYLMALAPVFGEIKKIPAVCGNYRVHGKNSTLSNDYVENYLLRFEHVCTGLANYLSKKGITVDSSKWPRSHWFHRVFNTLNSIKNYIPCDFILVDGNDLGTSQYLSGKRRYQFLERDGVYYGAPQNDDQAIIELENLKRAGARALVFTWTAFWYLDYYRGFSDYVHTNYKSILKNEDIIAFDLK
jgi:glycosyltransferase involved in cell wall biosynthesis